MSAPAAAARRGRLAAVALVASSVGSSAGLAADPCRWPPIRDAEGAATLARRADAWMSFSLARPEPLRSVTVRDHGGGTGELLLDGVPVDLRETLVRTPDAGWRPLGRDVPGCASSLVPDELPAEPFAPLGGGEDSPTTPPTAARWIALAEIPTVLEQWIEAPAVPVEIFAAPHERAPVVAVLRRGEGSLPTAEWGYEQPGAFVVEQLADWVRIRLADGSGWISRADAGRIHPLAELVVDGLAYLTASWDGRLYAEPRGGEAALAMDGTWRRRLFEPDRVPIVALESRTLADGAVWLRVRVTSRHCADVGREHVWAEGWVALAGDGGEPAVGFYSRGC